MVGDALIRVMIVDDHAMLRDGLRNILEQEPGLTVAAEASDGETAAKLAADLKPDVVLMDIHLPGIDGIEATRRIRQASPGSAVIILTMHDAAEFLFAAIREGAAGYLLKSLPSAEVVRAVQAAARGESLLDPAMTRKLMQGFATLSQTGRPTPFKANDLTPREYKVLELLVQGASNRKIAQSLFLSDKTVKQHMTKILRKLGVQSRSQAIIRAVKSGMVK